MNFVEKYLFETLKDEPFSSSSDFRKKIKKYDKINIRNLYVNIINYQINKYGSALYDSKRIEKTDLEVLKNNEKSRKKYQKIRNGTYKNLKLEHWKEK